MVTFKHQTWLKCQTSLQGLKASKCKVSWVPTDFNQAPASTREMKRRLQLCLPMKGQVCLQVLTMAQLQSPPEPKEKPLTDLTAFGPNPRLLSSTGALYETQPPCDLQQEVFGCTLFTFLCVERGEPSIHHIVSLFSRTCLHSLLLLSLCNTLGRKFSITNVCFRWNNSGKRSTRTVQLFLQASITEEHLYQCQEVCQRHPWETASPCTSDLKLVRWPSSPGCVFALLQKNHPWSGHE